MRRAMHRGILLSGGGDERQGAAVPGRLLRRHDGPHQLLVHGLVPRGVLLRRVVDVPDLVALHSRLIQCRDWVGLAVGVRRVHERLLLPRGEHQQHVRHLSRGGVWIWARRWHRRVLRAVHRGLLLPPGQHERDRARLPREHIWRERPHGGEPVHDVPAGVVLPRGQRRPGRLPRGCRREHDGHVHCRVRGAVPVCLLLRRAHDRACHLPRGVIRHNNRPAERRVLGVLPRGVLLHGREHDANAVPVRCWLLRLGRRAGFRVVLGAGAVLRRACARGRARCCAIYAMCDIFAVLLRCARRTRSAHPGTTAPWVARMRRCVVASIQQQLVLGARK